MKYDFDKYKNSLRHYLSINGIRRTEESPIFCINPDHSNDETPAMILHDDGFVCKGCGFKGDIYDACQLFTGITDKIEQYKSVELALTGFNVDTEIKKKETFKPDPAAVKKFESFVRDHKGRTRGVKAFLKKRGYNDIVISKMVKNFGYWPGLDEAKKDISLEELEKAGIYDSKKEFHAWHYSGVVIRLGFGYKLMYYKNDKCEKRNSRSAKTFLPSERLKGNVLLTEAETSEKSMSAVGFENVHSTGGTNGITKFNVDSLLDCDDITFVYDGDNAGRYFSGLDEYKIDKKTGEKTQPKRPIDKLWEAGYKGTIHAARLPDSRDGDDMVREDKIDLLKSLIEKAELINPSPESLEEPPEEEHFQEEEEDYSAPFHFLGYDDKSYYVLPKNQQIYLKFNRGETSLKNNIYEAAKEDWWFDKFNMETETKDGMLKVVFDKKSALTWFRNESYKAGLFDEKRIKGLGTHIDGNNIILNTGRELVICGNGRIPYDKWYGDNFYIRSKRIQDISNKKWTTTEGKNFWKQINTFSFDKKMDAIAVAGYSVIAPFAPILHRRPNILITAQRGMGKSTLMEDLIVPAVGGKKGSFFTDGKSSEAYIRQSLMKDYIPVIIDEFEPKNPRAEINIQNILNLMTSSYGGDFNIGKGSANHQAVDFDILSMFCFGAVNVKISNSAELSRIHVCRMKESNGICRPPEDWDGLRGRTFSQLFKILEDIKICKSMILEAGLSNRVADTYSPFLVGTWNLVSDLPFLNAKEPNDKIINYIVDAMGELLGKQSEDDEDRIIERILQEVCTISPSERKTIAKMLDAPDIENVNMSAGENRYVPAYDETLQNYGIRKFKQRKTGKWVIAFALKSAAISKILADTPFTDYQEILQRNDLIIEASRPMRFSGGQARAATMDWEKFKDKYLGVDSE
jgi:hypothetical protein